MVCEQSCYWYRYLINWFTSTCLKCKHRVTKSEEIIYNYKKAKDTKTWWKNNRKSIQSDKHLTNDTNREKKRTFNVNKYRKIKMSNTATINKIGVELRYSGMVGSSWFKRITHRGGQSNGQNPVNVIWGQREGERLWQWHRCRVICETDAL